MLFHEVSWHIAYVAPAVAVSSKSRTDSIFRIVAVAINFEMLVIVPRQHRFNEIRYRVAPQVTGYIGDPELASSARRNVRPGSIRKASTEAQMFIVYRVRRQAGCIVECEQQIAMRGFVVRLEFDRFSKAG
jgi:hypothetical protein